MTQMTPEWERKGYVAEGGGSTREGRFMEAHDGGTNAHDYTPPLTWICSRSIFLMFIFFLLDKVT